MWLASYPRSGNTFLRVILNKIFNIQTYSIYNDRFDIGADEKTSDVVGHQYLSDDFDLSNARDEDKYYFIKTHELPDERVDQSDKVIYLMRDGRESMLSFMRFLNKFRDKACSIDDINFGAIFNGSWGEHVNKWSPNKRENTLLIKFEDLIDDPEIYVKQISDFINVQPIADGIPGFNDLKEINPKFFSSGKKDSWKNEYSEGQHISFWLKNHTQMIEYGYTSDIPEVIKAQHEFSLFKQLSAENTYLLKKVGDIKNLLDSISHQNNIANDLRSKIKARDEEIRKRDQIINEKHHELTVIKNSFLYRVIFKFKKILRIDNK